MKTKHLLTAILALMFAVAAGCGGKEAPPPVAAPAKPKAAPAPATAAVQGAEEAKAKYRYDPYNKPDPFESFILTSDATKINPTENRDVSEFRLKGIIWNIKSPFALVEDPTGKGYMLKTGSKIGRNNGEIISISRCEVVVLEKITDLSNRVIKTNKVPIKLPDCR